MLAVSTKEEAGEEPAFLLDWQTLHPAVSPALFQKFQHLIYSESGISLGPAKTALLCGRLSRRLRALNIPNLAQYYKLVVQPDQHRERVLMIDAITTNETHFFREPRHFEFLVERLFPVWRVQAAEGLRARKVRIWSAGCSSGEEPYSLAMWLAGHLPSGEGWDIQIFATDISTAVLARAQAATYDIARSADIPNPLLRQFMLKGMGEQEGKMKVRRVIREMVRFERLNLNDGPYPTASFDLILCRNVLIYFDAASKKKVVEQLSHCLSSEGIFFCGHAENLNGFTSALRSLGSTIYCRPESHHRLVRMLQAGNHHHHS